MSDETLKAKPWALLAYTVADDESGGDPIDAVVIETDDAVLVASRVEARKVKASSDTSMRTSA